MDEIEHITPTSGTEFRAWLAAHHANARAVWVVYLKAHIQGETLTWSEAVDEALCFGWIDSKINRIDDDRYEQYFTRRKPTSPWSRVNKAKAAALEASGRLEPAGRESIDRAKRNGSWNVLDGAEALVIPDDLDRALSATGRENFERLPPSRQRNILQWIVLAKRDETRQRRIAATAQAAAVNCWTRW